MTTLFARTGVAAVSLAVCIMAAVELAGRADRSALVLHDDPIVQAEHLAAEGRWAEARMLAEFVSARPELGDADAAQRIIRDADDAMQGFWGTARRFADGAVSGEPYDTASLLGSLTLDLFVIGDIRDLAVQGWKQLHTGDGDTVIMALSAVGLTASLAPQADWIPALLKALRKTGALSRRFANELVQVSARALRTRDFARLNSTVADLGSAARHLGPGALRGVMPAVESGQDLTKVAAAAGRDANSTYALAALFGNRGIKRLSKDGRNISGVATTIKSASRLAKLTRKLTWVIPTPWLAAILIVAATVLLAMLRPPRRRRRTRAVEIRIEPTLPTPCAEPVSPGNQLVR